MQATIVLPCSLVYGPLRDDRMSPPLRASNEGLLRPRVARAQGTHRAIPPPAGGLYQQPASGFCLPASVPYAGSIRQNREEDIHGERVTDPAVQRLQLSLLLCDA